LNVLFKLPKNCSRVLGQTLEQETASDEIVVLIRCTFIRSKQFHFEMFATLRYNKSQEKIFKLWRDRNSRNFVNLLLNFTRMSGLGLLTEEKNKRNSLQLKFNQLFVKLFSL